MAKDFLKYLFKKQGDPQYLSMWVYCCMNCDEEGYVSISESGLVSSCRATRKMANNFIKGLKVPAKNIEMEGKMKKYTFNISDVMEIKESKTEASESTETISVATIEPTIQDAIESITTNVNPIPPSTPISISEEDHPIVAWIKKNKFENVLSLSEQLTNDQGIKLKGQFDAKSLSDIIREMDADPELKSKYTSVYATILEWRKGNKIKSTSDIVYKNTPVEKTISENLPTIISQNGNSHTKEEHIDSAEKKAKYKRTIEERETKFKDDVFKYNEKYPTEMLEAFLLHWTQYNEGDKKMMFEKERDKRAFHIGKRLATWKTNEKKFSKNGQTTKNGFGTSATAERQARTDSRQQLNAIAKAILTSGVDGQGDTGNQ